MFNLKWAIENGILTFEPGAGSPHKIFRGFEAVANTSLHRFCDPRLKMIFEQLIDRVFLEGRMPVHQACSYPGYLFR